MACSEPVDVIVSALCRSGIIEQLAQPSMRAIRLPDPTQPARRQRPVAEIASIAAKTSVFSAARNPQTPEETIVRPLIGGVVGKFCMG